MLDALGFREPDSFARIGDEIVNQLDGYEDCQKRFFLFCEL